MDFKFRMIHAKWLIALCILLVLLKPELWEDALEAVLGFLNGFPSVVDFLKHHLQGVK